MIVDFLKGRMPAYLETGLNLIHVADVARGTSWPRPKGKWPKNISWDMKT